MVQQDAQQPKRSRRRLRNSVIGSLVGVLVLWVTMILVVLVNPSLSDPPTDADAIVILGPALDDRLNTAIQLAHQLHITQLAISVGDTPEQIDSGYCAEPPAGVHVTCFVPNPYTTRGEAQEIQKLAGGKGWANVIVITSRWHISRAHYLVSRCFGGTIQMVDAHDTLGLWGWVKQSVYQTGAFFKAFVGSGC